MSSFPFVFYFFPLYIHTYINSLFGFYLKHEKLVNEHDTKDINELKQDCYINYNIYFGVWAQFSDKFFNALEAI